MATTPGFLTDWPWKHLGNFKYMILAPWAVQSMYMLLASCKGKTEMDYFNIMIIPFMLLRMLHNQLWVSISRHRTAKGNNRIVDRSIEFEQVDREVNWDDQIVFSVIVLYFLNTTLSKASYLPFWRGDGLMITVLIHIGPIEYLYYWLHRGLHHHYLYSRYHSHHHSSITTEPISAFIHPFGEHIAYFLLFSIPLLATILTETASVTSIYGYVTYLDFMNNMGHCNFEFIPKRFFSIFPPLKYMMYTPSFHSLHHTQFRTNYSLFVPLYDYIYGTVDKSTTELYETSLKRQDETPDVVHLTHLTTLASVYHIRLGFSSFASKPEESKWYMLFLWPITCWSMIINIIFIRNFVVERNTFNKLKIQSWVVPRYKKHYHMKSQKTTINNLIEEAILEADAKGAKVLSFGLLNQDEELNNHGELYIQKHPRLNIKVVDGSSLVVAIVLNSIPDGTSDVLLCGNLSNKVASSIAIALCQKGVQVATIYNDGYMKLKLNIKYGSNLHIARSFTQKIWLVGEGLTDEEQNKALKGTIFIPFSQFPPKKLRSDCFYHCTPAMIVPKSLENIHCCENWLERRVKSAWHVAGIVHALEGWNTHECGGNTMFNIDQVWKASLKHGFCPVKVSNFICR